MTKSTKNAEIIANDGIYSIAKVPNGFRELPNNKSIPTFKYYLVKGKNQNKVKTADKMSYIEFKTFDGKEFQPTFGAAYLTATDANSALTNAICYMQCGFVYGAK